MAPRFLLFKEYQLALLHRRLVTLFAIIVSAALLSFLLFLLHLQSLGTIALPTIAAYLVAILIPQVFNVAVISTQQGQDYQQEHDIPSGNVDDRALAQPLSVVPSIPSSPPLPSMTTPTFEEAPSMELGLEGTTNCGEEEEEGGDLRGMNE